MGNPGLPHALGWMALEYRHWHLLRNSLPYIDMEETCVNQLSTAPPHPADKVEVLQACALVWLMAWL